MILIKLAILAVSGFFFTAVTATALAGFLVLSGKPEACVDRSLTPAPQPDPSLQANWDTVFSRTGTGEAVALSVTEEQATTLARGHLDARSVPVEDLQVYFCPDGTTEALGKVSILGVSSDVLVKGRLDTSREGSTVQIDSVKAGNVPSIVAEKLLDLAWDGSAARTLPVTLNLLSMDVGDGEAIVVIGP